MNKKIKLLIGSLLLSQLLVGCDQGSSYIKVGESISSINKKSAASSERKRYPPTDPSKCENNPEGYLYFQVGDELFRTNRDTPLVIGGHFSNSDPETQMAENGNIPKGCFGNPYRKGEYYVERNYKSGRDDLIIEAETEDLYISIEGVLPSNAERLAFILYSMKDFSWENRKNIYRDSMYGENGDFVCFYVAVNLVHCDKKFRNAKGIKDKFGVYVGNPAIAKSAQGLPFVLMCNPAIPNVKCGAFYRLYPTVNIDYSIRFKNPEKFNPSNFLPLDEAIRNMYESMRVVN